MCLFQIVRLANFVENTIWLDPTFLTSIYLPIQHIHHQIHNISEKFRVSKYNFIHDICNTCILVEVSNASACIFQINQKKKQIILLWSIPGLSMIIFSSVSFSNSVVERYIKLLNL